MQLLTHELRRTMQAAIGGPGDGPTLHCQYLVRCKPLGFPAAYHVRIFQPPRQRPLVILGELGDNHSTNITNGAEVIASAVSEHILRTWDENAAVWVQYEPAEQFFYPPNPDDDSDNASVFGREDAVKILRFTPGFASVGWQRIDHEKLEQLAGGPVRRWHVYDYTIAAVTLAGAEPAELTIPNPAALLTLTGKEIVSDSMGARCSDMPTSHAPPGPDPSIVPAMYRDPDEPTGEVFRVVPPRQRKPSTPGDLAEALRAAGAGHSELRNALNAAMGAGPGTLDPHEPAVTFQQGGLAIRQRRWIAHLQRTLTRVDTWILISTIALVVLACLSLAWSP
jgi:hypothetical protein